ncbi:hypothetical protein GMO_09860 [Gluconobacter morbifer G707]|uniref:Uncharacterized protein n=1 Tax=Gluconobacter morbifer G707 TaxID=1088869 RepID=G6XHM0_9PROT|nr:hypothetical protein GMO_09860 [Gluconobacter morbifer G707]
MQSLTASELLLDAGQDRAPQSILWGAHADAAAVTDQIRAVKEVGYVQTDLCAFQVRDMEQVLKD